MTDRERKSLRNCLLLCGPCHREIDTNVKAYPTELLLTWRPVQLCADADETADAADDETDADERRR